MMFDSFYFICINYLSLNYLISTTTIHLVNCTRHFRNYNFCFKLNHDNRTIIFFFFLQSELQMNHPRQNT